MGNITLCDVAGWILLQQHVQYVRVANTSGIFTFNFFPDLINLQLIVWIDQLSTVLIYTMFIHHLW